MLQRIARRRHVRRIQFQRLRARDERLPSVRSLCDESRYRQPDSQPVLSRSSSFRLPGCSFELRVRDGSLGRSDIPIPLSPIDAVIS